MPSYLNALGLLCALGEGKQAVADALLAGDASGMRAEDGWVTDRRLTVGAVRAALPAMPAGFDHAADCRLVADDQGFDGAVAAVAHPAAETKPLSGGHRPVAIAHALHPAGNRQACLQCHRRRTES